MLDPVSTALVDLALQEDLAAGDVTTEATVPPEQEGEAVLVAREACVVAGLEVAALVFRKVDPAVSFEPLVQDGERVGPGGAVARIRGRVASILVAERTALNFLRHLSGVATVTARFVAAAGPGVRVVDTRKTTPGMRALEKAAVRAGGGHNHRFFLGDGVMIKDNHLAACGGDLALAVSRARQRAHHLMKVEVEVTSLEQLQAALEAGADVILLDNMTPEVVARAVALARGRAVLEASGGIDLDTIRAYAATGVDVISVGALTHSAGDADLALDLVEDTV